MKTVLSLLAISLLGFSLPRQPKPQEAEVVSTIALIGNPDKYHGKPIMTVGYLSLGREANKVYVHKEDFDQGIVKNGIWLELSREQMGTYKDRVEKYVFIEGVFNARESGHFGMPSGAIEKIKRIDLHDVKKPPRPRLPISRACAPTPTALNISAKGCQGECRWATLVECRPIRQP